MNILDFILTVMGMSIGILIAISVVLVLFLILILVCNWRIFVKIGRPGWASIVPCYNSYCIGTATGIMLPAYINMASIGVIFILRFLPFLSLIAPFAMVVAMISGLVLQYNIIDGLCRPKWFILLAIFCPIVYYPLMAFTD